MGGREAAPFLFSRALPTARVPGVTLMRELRRKGRLREGAVHFPLPISRIPVRMNQPLRDRIARRLESLPDERLYQVLDYVEFLESKYATRQAPPTNVFTRFAETVEDRLRAGRVSATTIAETMTLMNKAMGVLNGVAAAGKSVANDIVGAAASRPAPPASSPATGPTGGAATGPVTTPPAAAPPPTTPPSSSGEHAP